MKTGELEIIRGAYNLRARHKPCVATIGNFDGVHLGHQALLGKLQREAQVLNLPATLISFEPLPHEVFASANAKPRLSTLRDRLAILAKCGIERLLLLPFSTQMAAMSATDFIDTILVGALGIQYLVIGDDFHFGKDRSGDLALLKQAGDKHGFVVEASATISAASERISSTRIRLALQNGDMQGAAALLGRAYSICGRVVHGDKRGRELGYPTANILLNRQQSPLVGVYVVRVRLDAGAYFGVANIGTRPTVNGKSARLEVHVFDFEADLYSAVLEVEFLHKIRAEQKFANLDALKTAIANDSQQARDWLAQRA